MVRLNITWAFPCELSEKKIKCKKNPAYGRQQISRPMRTVAPIFNRPGVAGAVLQTALSFIDSLTEPL